MRKSLVAFIRSFSLTQLEAAFFLKPGEWPHNPNPFFQLLLLKQFRSFYPKESLNSNLLNQDISTGLKNPYLVSPKNNDRHSFFSVLIYFPVITGSFLIPYQLHYLPWLYMILDKIFHHFSYLEIRCVALTVRISENIGHLMFRSI